MLISLYIPIICIVYVMQIGYLAIIVVIASIIVAIQLNANTNIRQQDFIGGIVVDENGNYSKLSNEFIIREVAFREVSAKRGYIIKIPVYIAYESINKDKKVTLTFPSKNVEQWSFSWPETWVSKEDAERLTAITDKYLETLLPKGTFVIDGNRLIEYEPNIITLTSGENATISMYITIPNNLPDRVVGKSLSFNFSYDSEPYILGVKGEDGIEVRIIERRAWY